MELAVQATQHCEFQDWWWKVQLAKCYFVVNLIREAEQQLRSSLKQQYHIETFIRLTRAYVKLGRSGKFDNNIIVDFFYIKELAIGTIFHRLNRKL